MHVIPCEFPVKAWIPSVVWTVHVWARLQVKQQLQIIHPSVIILDVLNGSASGDTEINDNSDLHLGQFHKSKSAVIPASELEPVPMTAA